MVTTGGRLVRVARSGPARTVRTGVAAVTGDTAGRLWALAPGEGLVLRLDPATGATVLRGRLPGPLPARGALLAAAGDGVWAGARGRRMLAHVSAS